MLRLTFKAVMQMRGLATPSHLICELIKLVKFFVDEDFLSDYLFCHA